MRLGLSSRLANCTRNEGQSYLRSVVWAASRSSERFQSRQFYHQDARNRLSKFWIPSSKTYREMKVQNEEDPNVLLVRAGFVRQAYSGIFHLLPLGLRVQEKIERLLDKQMQSLNASKMSLSSLSSQDLWSKSGRLGGGTDVFKFSDRKDAKWLLSPTHEEEITELVGSLVQSYRHLPVRLYQISRKYRDEPRPRQGLLRSREFLMKDLYTFDVDVPAALQTYDMVRAAYARFFEELKMPFIVAKADSGNMGGKLSHEYHLPSVKGEDSIISCSQCDQVRNEEVIANKKVKVRRLAAVDFEVPRDAGKADALQGAAFITQDKKKLVKAYCQSRDAIPVDGRSSIPEINPHAVKAALAEVALGIEKPSEEFFSADPEGGPIIYLFDDRVTLAERQAKLSTERNINRGKNVVMYLAESSSGSNGIPDLARPRTGDKCPACSEGRLKVQKAIEVGHTFHLGTRYSEVLDAKVAVDPGMKSQHEVFLQMGCHGIGVSRLMAATVSNLSDSQGLNWPLAIAPFEVVIIPHGRTNVEACNSVYDQLTGDKSVCNDAIIDDREIVWLSKLMQADLVGYPIIIFMGQAWRERGEFEVQCRRLKVKQMILAGELSEFVRGLLEKL